MLSVFMPMHFITITCAHIINISKIFVKNLCRIHVNGVHFDELLVTLHT